MKPYVSKWYKNKAAAISLRFDDSTESHVKTAIPLLNTFDIKGTFMINPGRRPYQKHKSFWERDLLAMGHELGNHTWHHIGAKSIEKAEEEIGSVSKLIWSLDQKKSKLLVFASGGGEKWGGKPWTKSDLGYKSLIDKYHLIDLYDGNHPSIGVDSKSKLDELCTIAKDTIVAKKHQPFHFHEIRKPFRTLKGLVRGVLYGHDISFPKSGFKSFLVCLTELKDDLWIAPLSDVLKYEAEYKSFELNDVEEDDHRLKFQLLMGLDHRLYDHPLTLVIPMKKITSVHQLMNNQLHELDPSEIENGYQVDIQPVESDIIIKF